METIIVYYNIFLFFGISIYNNMRLDLRGHHLTELVLWRTMVWVLAFDLRWFSNDSPFIENDINELGGVYILRHLVEFSQQKDFSEKFSAVVGSVECVQNEFDSHYGTSWLLSRFDNLSKRSFAYLFLDDIFILKLVPRVSVCAPELLFFLHCSLI